MKHLAPGACRAVPEVDKGDIMGMLGFRSQGQAMEENRGALRERTHKAVERSVVREDVLANMFGFAVDWIFCDMEVIALSVIGLASLLCEGLLSMCRCWTLVFIQIGVLSNEHTVLFVLLQST